MPEYLAPGVYVEETSYRSKSIEGVSTTTTGMVGPARYGPYDLVPDLITSLAEFERTYGDGKPLAFSGGDPMPNFLWQGVRAFFEEGGKRLYVVRVFRPPGTSDGRAHAYLPVNQEARKDDPGTLAIRARFPGAAGKMRLRITAALGQNVLGQNEGETTLANVQAGDVVWVTNRDTPGTPGKAYRVEEYFDDTRRINTVRLSDLATPT